MDVKCGLCCQNLDFDEVSIDNNLKADKNQEILDTVNEVFGTQKVNPTVCNKCISHLKTHREFKQTLLNRNCELKESAVLLKSINNFISSSNEKISVHFLFGILMIVPDSKRVEISAIKFAKTLLNPQVFLNNLPIVICTDTSDDEQNETSPSSDVNDLANVDQNETSPSSYVNVAVEKETSVLNNANDDQNDTSPSKIAEVAVETSPLKSANVAVEKESLLSDVFSQNLQMEVDTDLSSCEMDLTNESEEEEVPIIKLEPNIQIDENELPNESSHGKSPTPSEKNWIFSNINEESLVTKKKNEIIYTCQICKKKCVSKSGAFKHVLNFHLRKKMKKLNSFLTSDEIQFIEENSIRGKNSKRGGKCNICDINFKQFQILRQHMIVKHLNKSLEEFNYEAMKNKLCKKGKLGKEYRCIICRDRGNPMIFNSRLKHLKHLRQHTKEDLKTYANEENEELPSPDDETFNHPVMQIKSESINFPLEF